LGNPYVIDNEDINKRLYKRLDEQDEIISENGAKITTESRRALRNTEITI
jgi:hypothetical protein